MEGSLFVIETCLIFMLFIKDMGAGGKAELYLIKRQLEKLNDNLEKIADKLK